MELTVKVCKGILRLKKEQVWKKRNLICHVSKTTDKDERVHRGEKRQIAQ